MFQRDSELTNQHVARVFARGFKYYRKIWTGGPITMGVQILHDRSVVGVVVGAIVGGVVGAMVGGHWEQAAPYSPFSPLLP